ncbi:MAG: helix-turn-helix transcriptional regulator [Pseudomonadales bacterium]|nr:helix-turn-helix transcriptional regulator [Pseudomonadales bacterium]
MNTWQSLSLSPEILLDLVGDLYQGPLESDPWSSFAERLRTVFAARNVAITLHHSEGQVFDTYVMARTPGDTTDWDEVEAAYRNHFMHDDPWRPELMQDGDIWDIDAAMVAPDIGQFLAAHDIGNCLRTSFSEPGGMRCWIDILRGCTPDKPFTASDIGLIRVLLPHLARALSLYSRQKRLEAESTVYEDTMDHLLLGIVLLDGELKILHTNRSARTIIETHPGISIVHGRLRLENPHTHRALDKVIERALAPDSSANSELRGELVRIGMPDGTLLGLLVHPLTQTRYYQGRHAPSVIVYLSNLTCKLDALRPTRESSHVLVAQLFGLTPQEARLALLLADGYTLEEAAGQLGVAGTAARSYSKRIYAKMGIGSQSDIVRLVYRSLALLR